LLSAREHSREELRRKLLARDGEQLDGLLDRLERRGYLSDERFAREYIDGRRRRGFGPVRIRAELRERGVSEAVIAGLLDESDAEWEAALRDAYQRKFGVDSSKDLRALARRTRFLEYRGFSPEQVRRFLRLDH
jgi:regulatory protein